MEIKFSNLVPWVKRNMFKNIMRVFIFLFCTTIFALTPNIGVSQNDKIKIENDIQLSIDEVFNLIENQTDYSFVFPSDVFESSSKFNLNKGTIRTYKLLDMCLSNTVFTYDFTEDQTILLKRRPAFVGTDLVEMPQQSISGKVIDKDGNPIPGVNVLVGTKGSAKMRGLATDFEGNYTIKVVPGEVIRFSYIGYATQEFKIQNQSVLNVTLLENTNDLKEVVISTGYQKLSKERATGSFESINTKTLGVKTSQNVFDKIEGEVAGILFDTDDEGNNVAIVRGTSTINSISKPLIVVDGFPIEQGLETINPNDVESITILKDAAAASIWGIRAANGVIVIVTSKGSKNSKTTINYSSNFSITSQLDLHDQLYGSTESFLEFEKHMADNSWRNLPNDFNSSSISKGLETYLLLNEGQISDEEANSVLNNLKTIDSRGQFEDLFLANQTWMQHNISVGGGGENSSYQASLVYNQNRNINSFKNNDRDQIIANISNQIDLTSKLTFTGRINYSHNKTKFNGLSVFNAQSLDQYQNILGSDGEYLSQPQGFYDEFKEIRSVENGYPYNWDYNLMQEFENKNNRDVNSQIRLQAALNYKITDYLSLEGRYQFEKGSIKTENIFNENTFQVRNLINTYTTNSGGGIVSAIPKGSFLDINNQHNETQSGRLQLNYNQSFKEDLHNISAIAGYEARKELEDYYRNRLYGYDDQSLDFAKNINYADLFPTVYFFGQNQIPNQEAIYENENRFISYYGNFAYTYDRKYSLTGSIRLDDANLFGASKKYKNIPLFSVGGKWDIYKEDFFESKIFDRLSLRTTYGSNGNVNNSTSPFVQAGISSDPFSGNQYAFISNVKNPELRLEKVYVTNLGVDFGMFNNRLNGSIEYYNRKSKDLLSNVIFPSILGFNSALINAGEMENKGVDISIQGLVVDGEKFKYNSSLNFSYNKKEVTKVDVPDETPYAYTVLRSPLVNTPLNYLYSYQFEGLNSEGDPQFLDENEELVNRDIDVVEALKYQGTTTPKFYGGWVNQFSYNNFTLRALTSFKLGHVFRNTNFLNYAELPNKFGGNHYIHRDFENRWQNPGDEAITDIPRIPTTRADASLDTYTTYYKYGSQLIDDASHIRLKEVVLFYELSEKTARSAGLNRLSVSFQATNLALINFNKWNVDPESLIFNLRPTFTLGLNANF